MPQNIYRGFYLPPRQIEFLRAEAQRLSLNASELIRRILDEYIDKKTQRVLRNENTSKNQIG
jgi:hypothetical protein